MTSAPLTLNQIIERIRSGEKPDYDDLRYAICAMDALTTFDRQAFMKLSSAEEENKPPRMTTSAKWQWEEHFNRHKRAGEKPPKEYVGWNNDPDNPEFQSRRNVAKRIVDRIYQSKNK